jgi:hypothetical protein
MQSHNGTVHLDMPLGAPFLLCGISRAFYTNRRFRIAVNHYKAIHPIHTPSRTSSTSSNQDARLQTRPPSRKSEPLRLFWSKSEGDAYRGSDADFGQNFGGINMEYVDSA